MIYMIYVFQQRDLIQNSAVDYNHTTNICICSSGRHDIELCYTALKFGSVRQPYSY